MTQHVGMRSFHRTHMRQDVGFATKCENLFASVFTILACAWQMQKDSLLMLNLRL